MKAYDMSEPSDVQAFRDYIDPDGTKRRVLTPMQPGDEQQRVLSVRNRDTAPPTEQARFMGGEMIEQRVSRLLTPHEVLDMHVNLQRQLGEPDAWMTRCMLQYAYNEIEANPHWGSSHFHPATRISDLEPWLKTLGRDLSTAATYQVTDEMITLAEALKEGHADLADIRAEDLPSEAGFMWFDRPIPRPSVEDNGREPLYMHAVSWQVVDKFPMTLADGEIRFSFSAAGLRVREWGFNDDPNVRPSPLHLMGQSMVPLSEKIQTPLPELWLVHMIWILMKMKITASDPVRQTRQGHKRAVKRLEDPQIRVVKLRRVEHVSDGGKPSATPKLIDWSCTWLVRGHNRKAPHGGTFADGRETTWIDPYIKGPEGKPLRVTDILYKLAR